MPPTGSIAAAAAGYARPPPSPTELAPPASIAETTTQWLASLGLCDALIQGSPWQRWALLSPLSDWGVRAAQAAWASLAQEVNAADPSSDPA